METQQEDENVFQMIQDEMELDENTFSVVFESSSDEEEEIKWGGSRKGKAPNKKRDFLGAYERVVKFYFNGRESVYNETDFERRF